MFSKPIYLLRHGAYDDGEKTLNERGIKQTEAVIAHLEHEIKKPFIISSQGPRAKETATILAKHFLVEFIVVDWLEKPLDGERLKTKTLEAHMSSIGDDHPLILVTNGEFIHQFVTDTAEKRGVPSGLRSLTKGEVMLCKIEAPSLQVVYF